MKSKTSTPRAKRRLVPTKLGVFHYFEVMDRAATAANNIEENIGTHPVVMRDARLKRVYETLSDALGAFYQAAGTRFFEIAETDESRATARSLDKQGRGLG